MLELFKVNL